ncbi:alpha/beta hydrolase [Phytomonospora sp. NPDC050363]|uniref:alpha/beta fold hydrolase n=1 Tax=Phytomonospora sp. NPDC050363 TaxID=3155642 RepID=UPI0033EC1B7A
MGHRCGAAHSAPRLLRVARRARLVAAVRAGVIVLPGLGDGAFSWAGVLPRPGRILDRLGLPGPFTLDGEVDRIARAVGEGPPPILVAHSMAACYAEAYARLRPVSGLVLIDPSYEDRTRAGEGDVPGWAAVLNRPAVAWRIGPVLWSVTALANSRTRIPARVAHVGRQRYRDPRVVASAVAEYFSYDRLNADLIDLRRRTVPPEAPVVILAATPRAMPMPAVPQVRLSKMFPLAEVRVLPGCGHLVHIDRPGAVRAAIAAVEE